MANKQEITALISRRGSIKGSITRFNNYLNNFLTNPNFMELSTRLEKIEGTLDDFEVCQSRLEQLVDDPEHETERDQFESSYYQTIARARSILKDNFASNQPVTHKSSLTEPTDPLSNLRLPPLNLPTFDGNLNNWLQFHDTFLSLIHNNNNLTLVQKLHYLLSSLKGEALQTVQSLQVSDASYLIAWDLICKRYQNTRIIINNYLKSIFDIPVLKKESKDNLRTLLDELQKNIRSLEALKLPVSSWDAILIFIVTSKLDPRTHREWENSLGDVTVMPTYEKLIHFLTQRCQTLEIIELNKVEKPTKSSTYISQNSVLCGFCKGTHVIYYCQKFLKLSAADRLNEIRKLRLCTKCLKSGHINKDCKCYNCKKCNKNHNTLLHINSKTDDQVTHTLIDNNNDSLGGQNNFENSVNYNSVNSNVDSDVNQEVHTTLSNQNSKNYVLLSTADILMFDIDNKPVHCRALLDSGSQSNYITSCLANRLGLQKHNVNVPVSGISKNLIHIKNATKAQIFSTTNNNYFKRLDFLILDKITDNLPSFTFKGESLNIPKNIQLADNDFYISKPIDMLLGAAVFWSLLSVGQIALGNGLPMLQKTHLGWVISGPLNIVNLNSSSCNLNIHDNLKLEQQLERFWNIEECLPASKLSKEEIDCENHFVQTTTRESDGRFVVSLPVKDNISELGESEQIALKQFYNLENRLNKNQELKIQYHDFLREYIDLGHMSVANDKGQARDTKHFYMPHHPVIKKSSLTTKCRVVFNASCKTTTGISLNDTLKVGPTIQDDLFSIICRFRCHNFVIIADVEKMYRMVNVKNSDRDLQRILWRFDSSEDVKKYTLNTVTYGTAPAAFLAVRALHQTAYDNINNYPKECQIILKDFYIDDLLTGASTIEEAKLLKNEITKILSTAGFNLRKWASNNKEILEDVRQSSDISQYLITDDKTIKTLGLAWEPDSDVFSFSVSFDEHLKSRVTKRFILSVVSQIFDPLGIIGPVILRAKLLLQQLWREKLGWDETVPLCIFTSFIQFYKEILSINDIRVPRHILLKNYQEITMHGFCDASIAAYGACVYLVSRDSAGDYRSHLLCAKSRVAPLKTVTLPRLELCGSLLLTNLVKKVLDSLSLNISQIFYWADSTIVLAWLLSEPSTLKTFVANRISTIQSKSNVKDWNHVRSDENPADIISRGLSPIELSFCELWWSGPGWLLNNRSDWPCTNKLDISDKNLPEKRPLKALGLVSTEQEFNLLERFSSFLKLSRVTAYCKRFYHNCKNKGDKLSGPLSIDELDKAQLTLVHLAQQQDFSREISSLENSTPLHKGSRILSLDPFITNNVLRVGGRLRNSNLPYEQRHPLILSNKNPLTKLLINHEHKRLLHASPQTVLSSLRDKFWILRSKTTVRNAIRKCLRCFKVNPNTHTPKMGDLPTERVSPAPPFSRVGLDFAGPYFIKDGKARSRTLVKAYICVFVCFATKALHFELVSDLTSEAFLNSLKRFISRRGMPSDIFSDNGTNFVGAANELRELHELLLSVKDHCAKNYLTAQRIQWHFIPPRAPHFGGLWEASVKSCKFHLKRILGDANLTFEQFYTVLVQIEAILNSRPLIPFSENPDDLEILTPSHFLIGRKLTSLPQRYLEEDPIHRVSYYERLQQLVQHFWSRWHKDYLSSLQIRSKWKSSNGELKPGIMVIIKEDHTAPFQWPIGRITEVHPGPDNIVRVVTVKTSKGTLKRAFNKICPLPV